MAISFLNQHMNFKKYLLIILLCLGKFGFAQQFPERPNRLVNDYTQTLSAGEVDALEQKLVAFDDSTSTQVAVVLIKDLEGYEVADYTQRLAEKWGIGGEKKNNGIIVLVSIGDRKVSIQTGYGMEGALPDAIARRIIETSIKPNFKSGNYYRGLDEATNNIIAYTKGEYKNDTPNKVKSSAYSVIFIMFFVFLFIIIISRINGGKGHVIGGGASSALPWLLMGGGFGGGGHSDSGGGGGGFGGFGGGSFGGGGASGDW